MNTKRNHRTAPYQHGSKNFLLDKMIFEFLLENYGEGPAFNITWGLGRAGSDCDPPIIDEDGNIVRASLCFLNTFIKFTPFVKIVEPPAEEMLVFMQLRDATYRPATTEEEFEQLKPEIIKRLNDKQILPIKRDL